MRLPCYTSTGGGFIGGGNHASVAEASKTFVQKAGAQLATMASTTEFPLPQAGRVRFYALTLDGVFTVEADENDLGYGRHPLSPLFHAGHAVLTQCRLVMENQ